LRRDFTYIDDIVAGIVGVVNKPVEKGHYQVFNIGNNQPVQLMEFIRLVEKYAGREAVLRMYPMQEGDVYQTYASIDALQAYCGYAPTTTIEEGLARFVQWYKEYYKKE
jgi:UDP-glucuronate 4-epimerase